MLISEQSSPPEADSPQDLAVLMQQLKDAAKRAQQNGLHIVVGAHPKPDPAIFGRRFSLEAIPRDLVLRDLKPRKV